MKLQEHAALIERLGGDPRVFRLLEIALTAYRFLPSGMINLHTGKTTRQGIIEAIESFGIRVAEIPWHRFPKRFHKNRPELQLFKEPLTADEIEQHFVELIAAAQSLDAPKKRRAKA